jgi:hypothetical protein
MGERWGVKIAPKLKGITQQSVKEVLQELVDGSSLLLSLIWLLSGGHRRTSQVRQDRSDEVHFSTLRLIRQLTRTRSVSTGAFPLMWGSHSQIRNRNSKRPSRL